MSLASPKKRTAIIKYLSDHYKELAQGFSEIPGKKDLLSQS